MYYLADIITLSQFVLTGVLCWMTFRGYSADTIIWVFIAAELCDAFDGPCARRWPYPENSHHWWRKPSIVQGAEHTSDIALLSALALFLFMRGNVVVRWITLLGTTIIASFSIGVEVGLRILGPDAPEEKRRRVIVIRRLVYLSGITIGIAELIFLTSWPLWLKPVLCVLGISIGIALIIYKWDRFTESHETFRDALRRFRAHYQTRKNRH